MKPALREIRTFHRPSDFFFLRSSRAGPDEPTPSPPHEGAVGRGRVLRVSLCCAREPFHHGRADGRELTNARGRATYASHALPRPRAPKAAGDAPLRELADDRGRTPPLRECAVGPAPPRAAPPSAGVAPPRECTIRPAPPACRSPPTSALTATSGAPRRALANARAWPTSVVHARRGPCAAPPSGGASSGPRLRLPLRRGQARLPTRARRRARAVASSA